VQESALTFFFLFFLVRWTGKGRKGLPSPCCRRAFRFPSYALFSGKREWGSLFGSSRVEISQSDVSYFFFVQRGCFGSFSLGSRMWKKPFPLAPSFSGSINPSLIFAPPFCFLFFFLLPDHPNRTGEFFFSLFSSRSGAARQRRPVTPYSLVRPFFFFSSTPSSLPPKRVADPRMHILPPPLFFFPCVPGPERPPPGVCLPLFFFPRRQIGKERSSSPPLPLLLGPPANALVFRSRVFFLGLPATKEKDFFPSSFFSCAAWSAGAVHSSHFFFPFACCPLQREM